MHEIIVCPNCRRRLQVPVDHMGGKVQCPTCETMFIAGEMAAPVPVQTPPPPAPDAVTAKPTPMGPLPDSRPRGRDRQEDDAADRPRRPRRFDRDKPKTGRSGAQTALIVLVATAFGGGLIGLPILIGTLGNANRPLPPIVPFPPAFVVVIPPPPPVDVPDRLLNAQEQQQHAKIFFDHFSAVMRGQANQGAELACVDADRLLDLAFEQKLIPAARQNDRPRLIIEFRQAVWESSLYRGGDWWTSFEIKTVKQIRPRELIALTRHANRVTGDALRLRWWLAHQDGQWRIAEVEDVDYGIRLSLIVAGALQGADPGVRTVRDAGNAMIVQVNINEAERILGLVRAETLPRAAAASHHMLMASIRMRQHRHEETLTECKAAAPLQPDAPGNEYLFAVAYSRLRRDALALKHARAAHAWLGDDPLICHEIGLALSNQGQRAEAAGFFRKVLDVSPDHKDAFLSLLRSINPQDKNDDIAPRFLKMKNSEAHFEEFAKDRWLVRDAATLKVLADALKTVAPRNADAPYYQALADVEAERLPAALATFRTALKLQDFEARREIYYTDFARTIVQRDQALEAYAKLPDPQQSFRALGDALKTAYKMDDLQDLVNAHAKKFPNDPYVQLFRADLLVRDEQYAQADQAFTKAFAEINDGRVQERYRFSRIHARYQTGAVVGAYADIGPRFMAFTQLANLCWTDKKMADLKKLLELHVATDPRDAQLPRFRWRLALYEKRFDEAGKALKKALAQKPGADPDRYLVQDFLHDAVDAGQALEGYRRAPDPREAMDILGLDLAHPSQAAELAPVIAEHEKRFPNDPVLQMLAGQTAAYKQDWATAAAAYRAGWKQLPEAARPRWMQSYLYAHFKIGKAVQAYDEAGMRPEHFRQLAVMLLQDKQIDAFEKLLEAHRPQRRNDPEFAAFDARLKILRGQSAQAADLMIPLLKDMPIHAQHRIGDSFLTDLFPFDVAVEAYLCLPDKRDAFAQISWRYHAPERAKEFARLIAEHAKNEPGDPRLLIERAELLFLQGDLAAAEKEFALAKIGNPTDYSARFGLMRCRIKLGKTADAYRENGASQQAFLDLASQCIFLKDGVELERLLAVHRQAHPAARYLAVWDIEANWQKKDYQAVVKAIQADRNGLLKSTTWRWKTESYLVRGLVRLKKSKEAIEEAEAITQRKGSQVLLVLALASTDDVPRVLEYLDKKKQRFLADDCYRDEDLGPILRGDAFRALQERYPPPPVAPFPNGRYDDDWD